MTFTVNSFSTISKVLWDAKSLTMKMVYQHREQQQTASKRHCTWEQTEYVALVVTDKMGRSHIRRAMGELCHQRVALWDFN